MNAGRMVLAKLALFGAVLAVAACGSVVMGQSALASTESIPESTGDLTVEVSADGVTYGNTFPGSLFGSPTLIPGSSNSATLWVRNPTSVEAHLRLSLVNVSVTDRAFADALSLRMAVSDLAVGIPMGLTERCVVLASGVILPAGESVLVSFAMALGGDLDGTRGQDGRAEFTLGVTLSEVDYPAEDCSPATVDIPGTDGSPASTDAHDGTTAAGVSTSGVQERDGRGVHRPFRGLLIDFNTGRLDQAFFVLLLGSAIGLAAGWIGSLVKPRDRRATQPATPPIQGGTQ